MAEHVLIRHWEGSSATGISNYWAECSCGWKTAFKTNIDKLVTEAMSEHAERVQALAVEASKNGQYL